MKLFISGPIDDAPIESLRRFDDIKKYFEGNGYEVITELNTPYPKLDEEIEKIITTFKKEADLANWLVMTSKKIWLLAQCEALFLLSDWRECHSCFILFTTARKLNMPIFVDDGSTIGLINEEEIKNWFESQIDPQT